MPLVPLFALAACAAVVPSEDPNRLARALETIRIPALIADLAFLSDDELGGRDTPSEGLTIAALYLAARLERLGFSSAGSGDFFHHYPIYERGFDEASSRLEFVHADSAPVAIEFGIDYFLRRSHHAFDRVTEGPVVSVGNGARSDFDAAELDGAWALLFDDRVAVRRAVRYAARAGAIGVLFAETKALDKPYVEKLASTTRVVLRSRWNSEPQAGPEEAELPLLMLSAVASNELLRGTSGALLDETLPPGTRLSTRVSEVRRRRSRTLQVKNVAGFWPGRDPELAREVIIVSAHYDHLGRSGDEIFNGADDNASGTTGLLAVAEALAAYGPLRRSVLVLWVSGEEKNLWGSAAWTADPELPLDHVAIANLNIDMIGRTAPAELHITPSRDHASFNAVSQAVYDLSPAEGFPLLTSQDADWDRSDHYNFDRVLKIPVAFLSAGEHPDYHRASDTAEKIDYAKLARITRLVVRVLDRIEDGPLLHTGD